MLFTKNSSPQLLLVTLILIFALPFITQGVNLPFKLNFLNSASGTSTLNLEKKLGTLIGARANLDLKSGNLKVASLEKMSTTLIKGDLNYNRLSKEPQVNFDPKDGVAQLDILSVGTSLPVDLSGNNWSLAFSPVVPIEISAKSGSGQFDLDLTELEVPKLKLDLGKTTSTLKLNSKSQQLEIVATEGQITFTVPSEASVKVVLPEGSSIDIATRFARVGEGYETEAYDKAKDKVEIKITPGSAKIVVN